MRGQRLHNFLAVRCVAILLAMGCAVTTEKRFRLGRTITDSDIYAVRDEIACAIEIETTLRSAVRNIAKSHVIPCDAYVVLVPDRRLAGRVRAAAATADAGTITRLTISTLGTLRQELTSIFRCRFQQAENGNRMENRP